MNISEVLSSIKDVVEDWECLGVALQIPYEILREIIVNQSTVSSRKEEMIMKWMGPEGAGHKNTPGPACWWLLHKALKEFDQNVAAAAIQAEQGTASSLRHHRHKDAYMWYLLHRSAQGLSSTNATHPECM